MSIRIEDVKPGINPLHQEYDPNRTEKDWPEGHNRFDATAQQQFHSFNTKEEGFRENQLVVEDIARKEDFIFYVSSTVLATVAAAFHDWPSRCEKSEHKCSWYLKGFSVADVLTFLQAVCPHPTTRPVTDENICLLLKMSDRLCAADLWAKCQRYVQDNGDRMCVERLNEIVELFGKRLLGKKRLSIVELADKFLQQRIKVKIFQAPPLQTLNDRNSPQIGGSSSVSERTSSLTASSIDQSVPQCGKRVSFSNQLSSGPFVREEAGKDNESIIRRGVLKTGNHKETTEAASESGLSSPLPNSPIVAAFEQPTVPYPINSTSNQSHSSPSATKRMKLIDHDHNYLVSEKASNDDALVGIDMDMDIVNSVDKVPMDEKEEEEVEVAQGSICHRRLFAEQDAPHLSALRAHRDASCAETRRLRQDDVIDSGVPATAPLLTPGSMPSGAPTGFRYVLTRKRQPPTTLCPLKPINRKNQVGNIAFGLWYRANRDAIVSRARAARRSVQTQRGLEWRETPRSAWLEKADKYKNGQWTDGDDDDED